MSLVLRYPFDESLTKDVSGFGRTAIAYGGVKLVDDPDMGKVIEFDGTGYLEGPTAATFDTVRSLSYWVYLTSNSPNQFVHYTGVWWASGWGTLFFSRGLRMQVMEVQVTTIVPLTTWIHVSEIYDGSTMSQYIDGVRTGTADLSNFSDSETFYLGHSPMFTNEKFRGKMSDFRIYHGALTPNEISNLYTARPHAALELELSGKLKVKHTGSTSLSVEVDGNPETNYTVEVAGQVLTNVKAGDTVNIYDLEPNKTHDCVLYGE